MPYDFARYLNIRSASTPVFAAGGQRVAFLSDITGNFQVWDVALEQHLGTQPALPPDENAETSWPQQLTFFSDKVWELHAAPSAPYLVAVSDTGGNERQQFYLITYHYEQAAAASAVETVDQKATSPSPKAISGHDIRKLTTDEQAIHRFGVWSKDSKRLYYTSNARNNVDFDLYVMQLPDGDATCLHTVEGRRSVVALSPDERFLLSLAEVSSTDVQLYLFDLINNQEFSITPGSKPARYKAVHWTVNGIFLLTDALHDCGTLCRFNVETKALTPILTADLVALTSQPGEGELDLFTVAKDGRRAALVYNDNGWSSISLVDLTDGSYYPFSSAPSGVISKLKFSDDGKSLLFDVQDANRPQDVWIADLHADRCHQLTFSNRAGIDATTFVMPSAVTYPTFDERSIPAYFYRPQQEPPAGGYPCILYVHGGPAGQLRPEFDVRFQYFLGQGYAILATNVRGSTGYGRDYMMLDEVERRMDSVTDLKYAVQWLHGQEQINSQRIAIYGRSYGGFMVLAAMTEYPELFAAGIDVVGIANWVTFLERTSPWRRPHREAEYGSLANHREFLEQISPIHKIDRIQVPLMVLAGDNDPRVPLFESEQVVERVQAAGGTVEFVHYADEGHKFSKLANRVDSFTKMGEFLRRYC